jgi:hypothetical protein
MHDINKESLLELQFVLKLLVFSSAQCFCIGGMVLVCWTAKLVDMHPCRAECQSSFRAKGAPEENLTKD